ncbi:tyrosine-type recombinase/integrase [Nonomuraea sp. NBC_00507]|uniref:tyrosine-type recombinase/integrase n=1 Tax=Nonomuraea sp. NBC_00507 TaxID=2976002 RepID=UPI002E195633
MSFFWRRVRVRAWSRPEWRARARTAPRPHAQRAARKLGPRGGARRRLELDGGEMRLGPLKSRAGRRVVSIPSVIVPSLVEHFALFVDEPEDSFVFLGKRGAFLRGGNFRREAKWADVLKEMGVQGLHFHDLRHTGNTLAAQSGASLADLKARMGHDSDRAALIYQHATRDADQRIADALSARVKAERKKAKKRKRGDDDGSAGVLVPAS